MEKQLTKMILRQQQLCRFQILSVDALLSPLRDVVDHDLPPRIDLALSTDKKDVVTDYLRFISQHDGISSKIVQGLRGSTLVAVAPTQPKAIEGDIFGILGTFVYFTEVDPFYVNEWNSPQPTAALRLTLRRHPSSLVPLGELTSYVGRVFAAQQRHHLFTVSVYDSTVRLIRWDRSQAIVSAPFSHQEAKAVMGEFYQLLGALTPFQKGEDACISRLPPSSAEIHMVKGALDKIPSVVRGLVSWDTLRCMVLPDDDEPLHLVLLASAPDLATMYKMFCRAGYMDVPRWAYDLGGDTFLLVQDCFVRRKDGPERLSDIYALLEQYSIPNIPRLVWRGDVPVKCCDNGILVHRFVLDAVDGITLDECIDPVSIVGYLRDICEVIESAAKHDLHHGRITPKNIRIHDDRAFLVNWIPSYVSQERFNADNSDVQKYQSELKLDPLERDQHSIVWIFVEAALRFATNLSEFLDPFTCPQSKTWFLQFHDELVFPPEVAWLSEVLEMLSQGHVDSTTYQKFCRADDASDETTAASDSSSSTLGDEDVDEDFFKSKTVLLKRKAEDDEDEFQAGDNKRARWNYVLNSVTLKGVCSSPKSTVYCPVTPDFLIVDLP